MDKIIDGFVEHGVLGLVVVGLAWYVFFLHSMYQKNMKETQERSDKSDEKWQQIAKDGNQGMKDNNGLLGTLTTLIESIKKAN